MCCFTVFRFCCLLLLIVCGIWLLVQARVISAKCRWHSVNRFALRTHGGRAATCRCPCPCLCLPPRGGVLQKGDVIDRTKKAGLVWWVHSMICVYYCLFVSLLLMWCFWWYSVLWGKGTFDGRRPRRRWPNPVVLQPVRREPGGVLRRRDRGICCYCYCVNTIVCFIVLLYCSCGLFVYEEVERFW